MRQILFYTLLMLRANFFRLQQRTDHVLCVGVHPVREGTAGRGWRPLKAPLGVVARVGPSRDVAPQTRVTSLLFAGKRSVRSPCLLFSLETFGEAAHREAPHVGPRVTDLHILSSLLARGRKEGLS